MDHIFDFAYAQQSISVALVNTTRAASQISAEDITFHRSSSANIAHLVDRQNSRLLALADRLIRTAATSFGTSLVDIDSIENSWGNIVDVVDNLLERSDICLDEYNGRFKNQPIEHQSDFSVTRARSAKLPNIFKTTNLPKPQLLFEHVSTNHESQPFRPLLSSKPHALVPLDISLSQYENEDGIKQYQHPYEAEIQQYQYPSFVYTEAEPLSYSSFENTQATFVDDYSGVLEMLNELKNATEIAIDLEHHDSHSYVGLVSLMQISTRDHDWIIDTLKPWRRKLEVLNEVFADPKILKVLHGAHMDIVWLQRDLGLYIVGLFDTHHASRVLNYSGGSLAFLLKKFIDFDAQKQYQMADWRMRPLPKEMFDYARSDTHFLLYIYDNIRNDLMHKNKLDVDNEDHIREVLDRSKETALQRFEHFFYDEDRGIGRGGWFNLLSKNNMLMSKEQFAAFRRVHKWRDDVARQEDENVNQIMPVHVLFNIARSLPQDAPSLLGVSHPISQPMRLRSSELVDIVRQSVINAAHEPEMRDKLNDILRLEPSLARKTTINTSQPVTGLAQTEYMPNSATISASNNNIRSSASAFWGETLSTRKHQNSYDCVNNFVSQVRISLPSYQWSDHGLDAIDRQGVQLSAPPNYTILGASKEDPSLPVSSIAIRGNGKRKIDEIMDDVQPDGRKMSIIQDEVSGTKHTDAAVSAKVVAVADKSVAKQARKALRQKKRELSNVHDTVNGINAVDDVMLPYDYDTAPSVLHGAKLSQAPTGGKKPFNPYAKAGEAASGLKKAQEFRSGKSQTFRH